MRSARYDIDMSTTTTNHVRRLESDPIAVGAHARIILDAVKAGKINGDRTALADSMDRLADSAEALHIFSIAEELRDAAVASLSHDKSPRPE